MSENIMDRVRITARPWMPQDLLDELQLMIDEESDDYLNTRRTTLEMALAYLKEHFAKDANVPSWISVTEQLPDRSGVFLVCTKHDFYKTTKVAKATYKSNNGGFYGQGGYWSNVTHWIPLSEPPKEGE